MPPDPGYVELVYWVRIENGFEVLETNYTHEVPDERTRPMGLPKP